MTFKSLGYEYVHIGSFWEPSATNVDADEVLNYGDGFEFLTALGETSALSLLSPSRTEATSRTLYGPTLVRRFHEYGFTQVEDAARRAGPTFVFAHFLLPHPPYVYLPDGSAPTAAGGPRTEAEQYVDQVQYTNQRVLATIDKLLASPGGEDAAIIVQGDEGPFPPEFDENQRHFAWLEARPEQVAQKFGILNALRIPGAAPHEIGLHPRSAPVNALRVVLNAFFDAGLPLLPETVYLSPDYPRSYDFVPVERDAAGLPIMSGVREDPGFLTMRSARGGITTLPIHPLLVAAYPIVFLFALNAAEQVSLRAAVAAPRAGRRRSRAADGGAGAPVARSPAGGAAHHGRAHRLLRVRPCLERGVIRNRQPVAADHRLGAGGRGGAPSRPGTPAVRATGDPRPQPDRHPRATAQFGSLAESMVAVGAVAGSRPDRESLEPRAENADQLAGRVLHHPRPIRRADRPAPTYSYDNEPFLTALEDRGFRIARHAHANYIKTPSRSASR